MKRFLGVFLKGAWIGGTLTVPGVSGGSMAMILGIYEQLISSVNALIAKNGNKRNAFKFLLVFSISALIGVVSLSRIVVWALYRFPSPALFFFGGIVAGGLPLILREVHRPTFRWYHVLSLIAGILIVVALSLLPQGLFELSDERNLKGYLIQLIFGIVAALALVLPGISVSHMLYVLGAYESIMTAVYTFDIPGLLPFCFGVLLGIALVSKMVEMLLRRFRNGSYMLIFGFVLGSVFELLNDVDVRNISFLCLILFLAGFLGMFFLFKKKADA